MIIKFASEIDRTLISTIDAIEFGKLDAHTGYPKEGEGGPIKLLSSHDHLRLFLQCDDIDGFNAILRGWIRGALMALQDDDQLEKLIENSYLSAEDKRLLILSEFWPDRSTLLSVLRSKYPTVLVVVYGVTGEAWRAVIPNQRLLLLPKEWVGVNPTVIIDDVIVEDMIFVHSARFFAAVETRESAEKIARELIKRFSVSERPRPVPVIKKRSPKGES
jgi:hypothetical protein